MERFLWDRYPSVARVGITCGAMGVALFMFFNHQSGPAVIPILLAAIAFHTEYSFSIDPVARTYRRRTLVSPFVPPKTGSLNEIRCIGITTVETDHIVSYRASFIFRFPKDDPQPAFTFYSGGFQNALTEVKRVADATGLPVVDLASNSQESLAYESIAKLVMRQQ